MKKITALALAVLMLAVVLSSCTININKPEATTEEVTTAAPETTKSPEEILAEKKAYYEEYFKSEDFAPAYSVRKTTSVENGKEMTLIMGEKFMSIVSGENYAELIDATDRLYGHIHAVDKEKATSSDTWYTSKTTETMTFVSFTQDMDIDYLPYIKASAIKSEFIASHIVDGVAYDQVTVTCDNSEEGVEPTKDDLAKVQLLCDPETHKVVKVTIEEEDIASDGTKTTNTVVIEYVTMDVPALPDASVANAMEPDDFKSTVGLAILLILLS